LHGRTYAQVYIYRYVLKQTLTGLLLASLVLPFSSIAYLSVSNCLPVCCICYRMCMCWCQLVKLAVQVVVIAHFMGCAFYWISSAWNSDPDARRWYNRDPTLGTSVGDLYVSSLYWAMTTVSHCCTSDPLARALANLCCIQANRFHETAVAWLARSCYLCVHYVLMTHFLKSLIPAFERFCALSAGERNQFMPHPAVCR
jgi:hypothetical protein